MFDIPRDGWQGRPERSTSGRQLARIYQQNA